MLVQKIDAQSLKAHDNHEDTKYNKNINYYVNY